MYVCTYTAGQTLSNILAFSQFDPLPATTREPLNIDKWEQLEKKVII